MDIKKAYLYQKLRVMGRPVKRTARRLFCLPSDMKRNRNILERAVSKRRKSEKINIVFILQYPEMWNSLETVYKAFFNDDTFKTIILTVPKQYGVNYSNGKFETENVASLFCKKNNMEYLDARRGSEWVSIEDLNPDFIFIQRPYDECMPLCYSLKNLSKYGILCYISYGYEFVNNVHLDIEYNEKFIDNVFCCFAENYDTYKYIIKKSKLDCIFGIRKVFNIGYPRFDLIETIQQNTDCRKHVLWTPRWSISDENDRSYFFDYINVLLDYFGINPDMKLVIRPHPLMFKNFIEKGVMEQNEIEELLNRISRLPNVKFDLNENYLDSFAHADFLISDFSTLVLEYFATNKPVIYCGSTKGFNTIGKEMAQGLYYANSKNELISAIEWLRSNEDKYFYKNRETINKYLKKNYNIGETIKDAIIKTYL